MNGAGLSSLHRGNLQDWPKFDKWVMSLQFFYSAYFASDKSSYRGCLC